MKFIEREEINAEKWDALVQNQDASFFSYAWYLDAVAENWCLLVDEDYSKGIALPYTKRMGVEILYVPIFSRAMHAYGRLSNADLDEIQNRFKVIELATTSNVFGSESKRVHQVITDFENWKLSSQAKRSLKKAENSGVTVTDTISFNSVIQAIEEELQDKFKGVDAEHIARLKELFQSAENNRFLKVFEVSDGKETGGIGCLVNDSDVLYLKGACPESLKKNGGMYVALNAAIEFAREQHLKFDFGGSNVEGVQRFNKNLGGVDHYYFYHESNKAPFWFQWARKLKNRGNR